MVNGSYHIIFELFYFLVRVNLMKMRKFLFESNGLQRLSRVLYYDLYKTHAKPKRHVQIDYVRLVRSIMEMKCELC